MGCFVFALTFIPKISHSSGALMITRLFSAAVRGVDAQEVEVEVNARGADKPIVINEGKTLSGS
jgi:hypothetical protein